MKNLNNILFLLKKKIMDKKYIYNNYIILLQKNRI